MFRVNNGNPRTRCETCSNLTIKTAERRHWRRSGVFIINLTFSTPCYSVSIVNFEQVNASWAEANFIIFLPFFCSFWDQDFSRRRGFMTFHYWLSFNFIQEIRIFSLYIYTYIYLHIYIIYSRKQVYYFLCFIYLFILFFFFLLLLLLFLFFFGFYTERVSVERCFHTCFSSCEY